MSVRVCWDVLLKRIMTVLGHEHRIADAAQLGGRGALPALGLLPFHAFTCPGVPDGGSRSAPTASTSF